MPISFHIRDYIRSLFRNNYKKRHNIMGEMRKGSKILVSHGYEIKEEDHVKIRIVGYDIVNDDWEKIEKSFKEKREICDFLFVKEKKIL